MHGGRNAPAGQRVHLFELGYSGDLDLKATAILINSCQREISVNVIAARRSIGEPDIDTFAYRSETLFSHFPEREPGEVYVGVTLAPLQGNYYTLSGLYTHWEDDSMVIITLHESQEVSEKAGRTKEEYVAQTLVTELLVRQYRRKQPEERLHHESTKGCIFDFTRHKPDKEHQLRSGSICEACAVVLDRADVSSSLVSAVTSVLARIQKPSLSRSLTLGLQRPLFSFLLGTVLGGLVINLFSAILTGQARDAILPLIVLLVLVAGLIGWNYVRLRMRSPRTEQQARG